MNNRGLVVMVVVMRISLSLMIVRIVAGRVVVTGKNKASTLQLLV